MSAPAILQVNPDVNETDVVLGQPLTITFDQAIDTTTLNDTTFSLTYPAPTQILTSNQLIAGESSPATVSIVGVWSFATDINGHTVAAFQASGFPPNTQFTAQLLGADAALSTENLMNLAGESMAVSYQWSFTTGTLNLVSLSHRTQNTLARARGKQQLSIS